MLSKGTKRILAYVCAILMVFTGVGENVTVAVAAGNTAETVTEAEAAEAEADVPEEVAADGEDGQAPSEEAQEEKTPETLYNAVDYTIDGNDTLIISASQNRIPADAFNYDALWRTEEQKAEIARIKHVKFEEGAVVNLIDKKAFVSCPNLEDVDLSNCKDLTIIDEQAFEKCKAMNSVSFPDKLQYIYKSAFSECTSLESVVLTKGLITIDASAFKDCTKLSRVTLETSNVTCGDNIFQGCDIQNIEFNNHTVVPGKLFMGAKFHENLTVVIPNYVQEIGSEAFMKSNLKNITFEDTAEKPSALASIASKAFSECVSLQAITFPTTLKTIEKEAFKGCESLTKVEIPNTVTTLGDEAFRDCIGINDLTLSNATAPENLGKGIFQGCISLTKVDIPAGLQMISSGEFAGCISLRDVTIANTVTLINNQAFQNCLALAEIEIPNSVEKIEYEAFKGCITLDNPILSTQLTELSRGIFEDCVSLTTLTVPGVVEGTAPNAGRKLLAIPEGITKIGSNAFKNCGALAELEIASTVTEMGSSVFEGCKNIGILTIKSCGIGKCGTAIFKDCLLKEVVFPEGITEIPANLFQQAGFTTDRTITIPKTVTKIGASAFAGTGNISTRVPSVEVNISAIEFEEGSALTEIGDSAFQFCTAISSFKIPDTTVKIGKFAFACCKKLPEITIPEHVESIGASAFQGCEVLTTVHFNAIAVTTANQNIFKDCNIHTILIGENVTILPAHLFHGAKFSVNQNTGEAVLVNLTIPANVGEIGDYAFANIVNLATISFSADSKLEKVGHFAFHACEKLTECMLPNTVTSIGNSAFSGCKKLTQFALPASLETLGSSAMKDCGLVSSYVVPENVTAIKEETFYENKSMETIGFEGDKITEIGHHAFYGCEKLKEIKIPHGTETIGAYAFSGCVGLKKVRVPSSVNEIKDGAFDGCTGAEFYVVKDSYAEKWLKENGFTTKTIYTITYVLDGGENHRLNIGGYEDGDNFVFYPATKEGCGFDGWYLDEEFRKPITNLEGRTGDLTIYAKWTAEKYQITYELDGGVNHPENPATYTMEDEIELKEPTKEGYKFAGWYTEKKAKVTKIALGSKGDMVLYAKWTPNKYTVTYDVNAESATVSPKTKTVTFGAVYGALATPKRTGYEFTGWYTEDNLLVTAESIVSVAADHTLYAHWVYGIRVEKPTANYASGSELLAGTKVSLSTKTVGASIYYTLDGTAPSAASTLYTDAIVIDESLITGESKSVKIRAIGIMDGYRESEIADFEYTIRNEATYWGDVALEDRGSFEDASKVPEGIWVGGVQDGVYTGKAITFELRVYDHKVLLEEKKDYTVKYSNNKNAANKDERKAPTVTITAKGNYKGKVPVKFNILPADIGGADFEADDMYGVVTGKSQMPVPTVTRGKTKLKAKRDFTVSYPGAGSGYTSAGTYQIELKGTGNYEGTRQVNFELKQGGILMSKVKVSGLKAMPYTGQPITQAITVKNGSTTLTEGTDYDVEYRNNVDAGTATLVLTGKNDYVGTKKATFKIKPIATIGKVQFTFNKPAGVAYTGEPIKLNEGTDPLTVTASYQGRTLDLDKDYRILDYSKNTDAGRATVIFEGMGAYSGTTKKTFKIDAVDVSKLKLEFIAADGSVFEGVPSYGYSKGGCKPDIRIDFNGRKLVAGKDYTVSYKDNTTVGSSATITVKGKKNFKGTLTGKYTVARQDIGLLTMDVQDVPYKDKAGIYAVVPKITDLDGKMLVAGTDFSNSITYTYVGECTVDRKGTATVCKAGSKVDKNDIIPVGTLLQLTVRGSGSYTGSISGTYRIVQSSIAKAKVKVENQSYTGRVVEPGKDQMTVKVGSTYLNKEDYEIVRYSNNVSRGTATVTLRGVGKYGGIITVKFKIVQKKFFLWF